MAEVKTEIEIPPCEGRVFTVDEGDTLRVIALEGPQAADMVAFNRHDLRESLSTWLTRHMSGSFVEATRFYTKLPAARIMFEALTDRPGLLWLSPGRCNPLSYRHTGTPHLSCQDILVSCMEELGMSAFDVPEVLNIFMRATMHTDGTYEFGPSPVQPGDSFDMAVMMDATVAISACPDDLGAYNEYQTRPLGIQVVQGPA